MTINAPAAPAVSPQAAVPPGELIARAAALVPLLAENAARTEADRLVAAENIAALEEAGLFRLTQPRRFGGQETDITTFIQVLSELGRGCASTAWVVCLINGVNWLAGTMSDQARQDFWGDDPTARFCGVFTETGARSRAVPGGQVVSGSWGFASGCAHAQWALVAHPKVDESGALVDIVASAIPMSELSVKDTWYVAGMAGTASNTLVADEVFVPEHRSLSVPAAVVGQFQNQHAEETLYHTALAPVLALILVGPQLGIVRGAIEHVDRTLAKGRPVSYTFYPDSRQAPSTQFSRVEAQQELDTATLLIERGAAAVDAAAAAGIYPEVPERARGRMDAGSAVEHLRAAMQHLLNLNGAGSFAQANPLQRMWRDLETASRHAVLSPLIAREAYGRVLVGVEEPVTPLL